MRDASLANAMVANCSGREDAIRAVLDGVRDSVAVRRPQHERLQDQHVEGALQHVALPGLGASGMAAAYP